MARLRKNVKRFTCILTKKTHDEMHAFADAHNLTYTTMTELALLRFMSGIQPDSQYLKQFRHKRIRYLSKNDDMPTPFSTNLSQETTEKLEVFSKAQEISKSIITELAFIDYMKKH